MTGIAVIGVGAMGSAIAERLISRGSSVISLLDGRSAETIKRAASAGMVPVGAAIRSELNSMRRSA